MKTIKLIIAFLILSLFSNISFAQAKLIFSVNTNPSVNIGLKMDNFVFVLGTDFVYRSTKSKSEISNQIRENEYSVFNINPGCGIKFYLYESEFSPFFSGNIHKEIPVNVDVKGDSYTKNDIEDQFDDFTYQICGGGDFSIKESLLIGFELGLYIRPSTNKLSTTEIKSNHISTFSNVTLTYMFN